MPTPREVVSVLGSPRVTGCVEVHAAYRSHCVAGPGIQVLPVDRSRWLRGLVGLVLTV